MVKIRKSFKRRVKAIREKKEKLNHAMEVLEVESAAYESGFYQRSPKKITASSLITAFWMMMRLGKNTLRNWAVQTGMQIGESVSKQAIDKRLNSSMLAMVKSIFVKAMNEKNNQLRGVKNLFNQQRDEQRSVLQLFNRILINDSTIQQVPTGLYDEFGGNKTSGGNRALMRIQAMYDLSNDCWEDFSVDTYRQNDQSRADFYLDKFQKGDLILRDLGYFSLDILEQLVGLVNVITSYKPNVIMFDTDGRKIDLLELLRSNKQVDQAVLVGAKKKLPMRLVARKLSQTQKKKKIRDAKKKAHAKSKYTEEYYELLGYEIFLTNIDAAILSIKQIAKLYGLRWYIEIIFKAWKSHFNFKSIFEKNKMNYQRTMISIYLVLIQLVYLSSYIFQYVKIHVETKRKYLSILKFMDVANDLLSDILKSKKLEQLESLLPQFRIHAVYEERKKYKNMKLKYQYFNELELECSLS